jgi:hypothetical protein
VKTGYSVPVSLELNDKKFRPQKKREKLKSHNLILNAKERKISVSEQR